MTLTIDPALDPILAGRRVVLCLGSGGVGKTTTSAAIGLALARAGERVVVLTIDPARRLADALGLSGALTNTPTLVDEFPAGGQLWALMLDPGETFRRIVEDEATSAEHAERILGNRLFVNLTSTLSGTNEYMAAERLHQLANDERFDRIVVDTPPSRHVLDFLDSPGRLTRFVDHRLYRSVLAPRHGLLRPLNTGARLVMRLLAGLVGSALVDDVVGFFSDFEALDQGFRRRAAEIDALLGGSETSYVLITTPRADRVGEADWILDNLLRRDRALDGVVVNRVPPTVPSPDTEDLEGPIRENLVQLHALGDRQQRLIDPLLDRARAAQPAGLAVIRLAEQLTPVRDLDGLMALADLLADPEGSDGPAARSD